MLLACALIAVTLELAIENVIQASPGEQMASRPATVVRVVGWY